MNSTQSSAARVSDDDQPRTNGAVLLSAGIVAGAIGGAASLLNELRKHQNDVLEPAVAVSQAKDEALEAGRHLVVASKQVIGLAREQAPDRAKAAKADAVVKLNQFADQAATQGQRVAHQLEKRGVDLDEHADHARKLMGQANEAMNDVREAGRDQVARGKKELAKRGVDVPDVDLAGFSQHGSDLLKQVKDRAPALAESSRELLSPKAVEFREKAQATLTGAIEAKKGHLPNSGDGYLHKIKGMGIQATDLVASATEGGRDHTPELRALFEEHLVPRLHAVRQRAAHLASDVVETSIDRAGQIREDKVPDISAEDLGKRFAESLGVAERALEDWRGSASHAVGNAGTQVRVVGTQAKEGGKNAGASVFWLGAAGVVVYAGLLKPEHRKKVRSVGKKVVGGARGLYRDIRGHDGDFSV